MDSAKLVALLRSCIHSKAQKPGLLIHQKLVFQSIPRPVDISLWNGLIAVLEHFERLLHFSYLKPDSYTYPTNYGQMVHSYVIKSGALTDVVVTSSIVGMYAKCGMFDSALRLFDEMPERDVACWNTIISCYYQMVNMRKRFNLEKGKHIHNELVTNGGVLDGFISAALVDMYGNAIPVKSLVSWNSIIAGYSLIGDSYSCIELFRRMKEEEVEPTSTTISSFLMACSGSANLQLGKFVHGYIMRNNVEADIFVNSSLLDLYLRCGSVVSADSVFRKIPRTNVVAWNVMISGYVSTGSYFEAFRIFRDMEEAGIKPNAITFTTILAACSQLAALERGRDIHKRVIESKLENDEIVMGAFLDMYSKYGAVEEALCVFNQLPERDLKLNVKPDRVTFLAVISACSHAGLVDEGCYYFSSMINTYGLEPTVKDYSCLVDLLGRAGRLHDAYGILQSTPSIRNDVGLLSTLFSACRLHGELELGKEIARTLVREDPDDHSTYVTLAKMYASDKRWDEARKVRLKMRELGLKNPGCSWIEVDKRIQPFYWG
ncbi:hypothetical protein NMG60_11033599 [Bertholletia excelsa]